MKFIIFACLWLYLNCDYPIKTRNLEKKGQIIGIRRGEQGIIVMDLSRFNSGDIIYLTFVMIQGNWGNFLNYDFSNVNSTDIRLNRTIHSYSMGDGYLTGTYTTYNDYYYKIKIPTNEPKANYLLIAYNTFHLSAMNVFNTTFARYTPLIISFSFFGIIILAILILFLFKHKIKVCWDRANPNQNNIGINNKKESENNFYPSPDNQEKLNDETEKEKIEIKDITDNNPQDIDVAPPQADYYPTSE